jgi:hypothetical protein
MINLASRATQSQRYLTSVFDAVDGSSTGA